MIGWKNSDGSAALPSSEARATLGGFLITGQSGLLSGTYVASNLGWRPVEALAAGDQVLTFDNGMQTVTDIQREVYDAPQAHLSGHQRPVIVPAQALYNRRDLWLMPEQGLLVESEEFSDAAGDPYVVVPAETLIGLRGIEVASTDETLETTTLAFARDEVIYVEGGLLAHCPHPLQLLFEHNDEVSLYNVLNRADARRVAKRLIADDAMSALACNPDMMPWVSSMRSDNQIAEPA